MLNQKCLRAAATHNRRVHLLVRASILVGLAASLEFFAATQTQAEAADCKIIHGVSGDFNAERHANGEERGVRLAREDAEAKAMEALGSSVFPRGEESHSCSNGRVTIDEPRRVVWDCVVTQEFCKLNIRRPDPTIQRNVGPLIPPKTSPAYKASPAFKAPIGSPRLKVPNKLQLPNKVVPNNLQVPKPK